MLTQEALVIYLMAEPETPELARGRCRGRRRHDRARLPVLGSACRRAGDPPRRRARARARNAHARLPRRPRRDARALPDMPLIPMTYASLLEAYGWRALRRRRPRRRAREHDRRRPPCREHPSCGAYSSSRRRRPTSGSRSRPSSTDGWLYLVTLTGTTGARGELSPALAGLVERARALIDVPALRRLRDLDAGARAHRRRARRRRSSSARARSRSPRRARTRSATTSPRSGRRSTRSLPSKQPPASRTRRASGPRRCQRSSSSPADSTASEQSRQPRTWSSSARSSVPSSVRDR